MGGGQDKLAWIVCPHGGEDNQGGGKISRVSLHPGGGGGGWGKLTAVGLPHGGQAVQGAR